MNNIFRVNKLGKQMKKEMFKTIGGKFFCLSVVAGLLTACGGQQAQQGPVPPAQVETMTIALGDANLERAYPAVIKGKTDIEIRPQVSGFITKVHVDEGQAVKKGQVLFTIDQVQLQAAVSSAEAAVVAARSNVATAKLTAENKAQLFKKNIISSYENQTAELALQSANAQLNQAESALVNARKNLSFAVVTAPSDGFVGSIPNREGSLVSASSQIPLTTISDTNEVYAYFSLNEKEILALTNSGAKSANEAIKDMPEVYLQLSDGTRYPLTGKVSTLSGVIGESTGSSSVRALFKNTNNMLHSGSTGSILIPQPSKDLIIVPQSATFEIQDMKYVYLVGDSAKATSIAIKVSPVNDGKNYIVTEGLKVGDNIVVEGVGTKVKDGVVIAPKQAATEAKK